MQLIVRPPAPNPQVGHGPLVVAFQFAVRRGCTVEVRPGDEDSINGHQPPGWTGYAARRVDAAMLAEVAWPPAEMPLAYACGPTSFVETVSQALLQAGYPPERVKTERFGATGGS